MEKKEDGVEIKVQYVSAPVYRISVNALAYKIVEAELSKAISEAKVQVKQWGTLEFKRGGK
jgi:translation initiation factor 2 alpha subunit (eIF-2alpha)